MSSKNVVPVRIVVTGGHHTPALAVMEELKGRGDFQFFWFGHRYSLRGEERESAEYRTVEKLGVPFFDLKAGRLYQFRSLREVLRVPFGFFQAFWLLLRVRPKLIISFGGYLAAPVVLAGFFLRIPAVTHEQTVVSGWANRFISLFAKKIFVSWKQSLRFFPAKKTILTGNPLRQAIFEVRTKRFLFPDDFPVVYITGGKQGAHFINEALRASLSQFLKRYNIIHQTGSSSTYRDYQKLTILKSHLPKKLARRYLVQEYFGEDEIGAVFDACSLVVGRAGANIIYEIATLGKPAILIPLPSTSHNEQVENAKMLEKAGLAKVILQKNLSSQLLLDTLSKVVKDLPSYKAKGEGAKKLVRHEASKAFAKEVEKILKI
jgi:UDP-N-acetylglucosamine--N-acetylmuramyl-(pentapeptide) pyrophosphoryl-undecaprenol N-acetylglucosamine transferase